jgi:hypothetical protein
MEIMTTRNKFEQQKSAPAQSCLADTIVRGFSHSIIVAAPMESKAGRLNLTLNSFMAIVRLSECMSQMTVATMVVITFASEIRVV